MNISSVFIFGTIFVDPYSKRSIANTKIYMIYMYRMIDKQKHKK